MMSLVTDGLPTPNSEEPKLEAACNAALRLTPLPRYKLIANLLASGKLDNEPVTRKDESAGEAPSHAFIRGAAYYGGERHDQ